MTMLFRINSIQVQPPDGKQVTEIAGYSADSILQRMGVQLEENIFSFEPGEKAAVLEQALDGACAVPLETMEACCEGIALAQESAAKGSALAVSDAGCAALFCKAALQASGLNVSINTKLMAARAHAEALNAKADALLAQYVPLADTLYEKMATQLRGEV